MKNLSDRFPYTGGNRCGLKMDFNRLKHLLFGTGSNFFNNDLLFHLSCQIMTCLFPKQWEES